jgi:alpha-mannosidase
MESKQAMGNNMNRRNFARHLGLSLAALASESRAVRAAGSEQVPTLYYADGYHGGVAGHMPSGSWRDIFNAMRELPAWKLSLDIEPESWDVLHRADPQAYRELKAYLDHHDTGARIEMVGCTFSQPYGWAIGGESNVRQLLRGCEVIRKHFPDAVLTTYAVQEPCWSSCLPQILVSLGFTGAVLRDASTAWGGYAAGFDAELVRWVGPDGTAITTVPRYACEALQKVYETESITGSPEFARKCIAHGIPHPVGMCFQDLGWPAKPRVTGDYIRYVTWREYIHSIADKPTKDWRFSIEDTLTTLPWGEHTLQVVAQQVRSAENRLLTAEKLAALAHLDTGFSWPERQFREAWDDLLLTQAHDAWITATTRTGRQAWSFQVASDTLDAEKIASTIMDGASEALSASAPTGVQEPLGPQWVRVMNTLAVDRTELAELVLATDRGTQDVRVLDASSNEVPCQVITTRKYLSQRVRNELSRQGQVYPADRHTDTSDGNINAATVLFRPQVPSLGYASYRVEPVYDRKPVVSRGPVSARRDADGSVLLESDLYRIRLDLSRGGAITSLYSKQLNREFCDASSARLFNEYRGYFISQKQWRSSTEAAATVAIQEEGPLRARVRVSGQVGDCPFQTTITLAEGQRRIDVQARFVFEQETWIGDPWDIKPEDRRSERRRSQNDGRWKLQAQFPVALKNQAIYKNAAYDVCRSRNTDTFFQGWDEIKHNIIVNWVDVADEQDKFGLAVLSDHTTAYTHGPDFPLSLVMAWGWEGGFWWGKRPLKGIQQVSYGLIPHAGIWNEAEIGRENAAFCEPLLTQIMEGSPGRNAHTRSFVRVSGNGIEIPTLLIDDKRLLIRLFNAEGDNSERTITLDAKPAHVDLVELDGRVIRRLPVEHAPKGGYNVRLSIPRFGLRTLRCALDRNAA